VLHKKYHSYPTHMLAIFPLRMVLKTITMVQLGPPMYYGVKDALRAHDYWVCDIISMCHGVYKILFYVDPVIIGRAQGWEVDPKMVGIPTHGIAHGFWAWCVFPMLFVDLVKGTMVIF